LEQVKFLAVFFKVSWSIVEEDLKKEYSGKIFTCKNCGNCCKFYEKIPTSRKDRFRWKAEERSDILLKLDHRSAFRSEGPGKEKQCPLLKKRHNGGFVCSIHKTKPECCKNWPFYLSQIKNVGTSWP
jgi:Fe-S-cluster containining protein